MKEDPSRPTAATQPTLVAPKRRRRNSSEEEKNCLGTLTSPCLAAGKHRRSRSTLTNRHSSKWWQKASNFRDFNRGIIIYIVAVGKHFMYKTSVLYWIWKNLTMLLLCNLKLYRPGVFHGHVLNFLQNLKKSPIEMLYNLISSMQYLTLRKWCPPTTSYAYCGWQAAY